MNSFAVPMLCPYCNKPTLYVYWHGTPGSNYCKNTDSQTTAAPHSHAYCDNHKCEKDWIVRETKG